MGLSLSYEEQFYEWNIVNMPMARRAMFEAALMHVFGFVACLALYYWLYDLPKLRFSRLSSDDAGSSDRVSYFIHMVNPA